MLILAAAVHVFGSPDRATKGAIGVLRSGGGQIDRVPSPLPTGDAREPQAVAAAGGGWHVLFVTGARGTAWSPFAYDTADIWYAHYDGRAWAGTRRIARVRAASLSPRIASNLVEAGHSLAFAFVFDRSSERRSNEAGNQGVVMLLRRHNEWREDTLPTWEAPNSVQLAAPGGKLRAIIAQSYFSGPALFTAGYDSTWEAPRMVYDPAPPQYVSVVMVATGGERPGGVAWHTATRGVEPEQLEWGLIGDHGEIRRSAVAQVTPLGAPAIVDLDKHATVLLVRDGDSRERLRVYVATDTGVRDVGAVATPLMNFVTSAVPLKGGRIIALTGGPDTTSDAEPPFASYLTEITVRCPAARR